MQQFGASSVVPRFADYPKKIIDLTLEDLDEYGYWLGEQVENWDMQDTLELKILMDEVKEVLGLVNQVAAVGAAEDRYGIRIDSLPSAAIPEGIDTSYPVWAMDTSGRMLIGEAMDNITTITDVVICQSDLLTEEPVRAADLPEPVRSWYLQGDAYTEDAGGYVYDPEQGVRPDWGAIVEEYAFQVWGIVP
jgi:hypothetical protein